MGKDLMLIEFLKKEAATRNLMDLLAAFNMWYLRYGESKRFAEKWVKSHRDGR